MMPFFVTTLWKVFRVSAIAPVSFISTNGTPGAIAACEAESGASEPAIAAIVPIIRIVFMLAPFLRVADLEADVGVLARVSHSSGTSAVKCVTVKCARSNIRQRARG